MKITLVVADHGDYRGLFLNGKLVYEDSHLELGNALDALGIEFEEKEVDGDWLDNLGRFPENLSEVPIE